MDTLLLMCLEIASVSLAAFLLYRYGWLTWSRRRDRKVRELLQPEWWR